jgi:outer membrane murein-binding lipoprotein Lpp
MDVGTIEVVLGGLTLAGGFLGWLGRRWSRVNTAVDSLHSTVVPAIAKMEATLHEVRGSSETTLRLAQEALRQAQSAHPRIDGLRTEHQQLALKVERIDERTTNPLRNTGRFRSPDAGGHDE